MKESLLILAAALAMVSCGGNAQQKAATAGTQQTTAAAPDMHNAETSLDYLGVYKGTLPAADCPGIETTLTLAPDGSYALHLKYIDRDSEFDEKGAFTVKENLLTLTPSEGGQPQYYKVEENRLRRLDAEKQPVTGALAEAAGGIQLAYFRGDRLSIETKSNVYDVVTRADRESEELIAGMIAERYPDHAILGEEGGCRGNAASDWRWVVDPLDGTTNYSQGLPLFTVSIALQYRGETIVGVVYAPYLNELFTATKGGGAYLQYASREPERIRVGEKQTLATSVIASGFPYDKDVNPDNNSDNVARIIPYVRDVRRLGSAAYDISCVAAGLLDGYWELALHEWDVCAAELILAEAGGVVCDLRRDRGISIVAGNGAIVKEILKYVR